MPLHATREHVIAYDIASPRRLTKIHRHLKQVALPIQYSVFLASCSPQELDILLKDLEVMMDLAEDDIRAYTLPRKVEVVKLGCQNMLEGIQLLGDTEYIQIL